MYAAIGEWDGDEADEKSRPNHIFGFCALSLGLNVRSNIESKPNMSQQ